MSFRQFGDRIRFTQAPYQADGQLVYLSEVKAVAGLIADDGDLLVLGANHIIRSLHGSTMTIEVTKTSCCMPLLKSPQYSLFMPDDVWYARYMWATILGNDNLLGGVRGVGPDKLQKCA